MRHSRKRRNSILHSTEQRRRNYKRRRKTLFFDIALILILVCIFVFFVKKDEEIPVVEKYSEEYQKQMINEELEKNKIPQQSKNGNIEEVPVPEEQSGAIIIRKITMTEVDEKTLLSFIIENNSKEDESSRFPIIFKDEDGKRILKTYVDVPTIKAGQQIKTNIVVDGNIKNVKSTELTDEQ